MRTVKEIIDAVETEEGEGFIVHRPFPTATLSHIDPFLLIDEMGPMEVAPGNAKGAPDHPHRGFETVTYLLSGEMEHLDSSGNRGKLTPGDVQWMTAGSGVIHSEMPSEKFQKSGGRLHGFQIWVNLPASDKMMQPRYQEIPKEKIPVYTRDGVTVRVIAGLKSDELQKVSAIIETRTPIVYLHYQMKAGSHSSQGIPKDYNALAYVISGEGKFNSHAQSAAKSQLVVFNHDGENIEIEAQTDLEFLLLAGLPLKEPVARYGPFVMNTREEIYQAFEDYQSGKMNGKVGSK